MFADYRVPQALLYFNVLSYSPMLLEILYAHEKHHNSPESDPCMNSQNMILRGDPNEVEIRLFAD